MKKGFTLIELLAVIVILAVIAVIAVPIVLNIINDTKESATLRSADFYLRGAETAIAQSVLKGIAISDGKYSIMEDGNICIGALSNNACSGDILNVEVSGNKPTSGTIEIKSGSISSIDLTLNDKRIVKNDKGEVIHFPCILKKGDKNTPGSLYECEVKPGTKYNFYVLSTEEDGTTNLIMDRNINNDGTVATKAIEASDKEENNGIYNLVEWISKKDYNDDANYGEYGNSNKGPITAINFLNNATNTWINIPNLDIIYNDENEQFNNFKITGKARLPYFSEVSDYDETNGYLFNYLGTACYDSEGEYTSCETAVEKNGVFEEGIYHIDWMWGYFTFSSSGSDDGSFVVYHDGFLTGVCINSNTLGVRPVINVKF